MLRERGVSNHRISEVFPDIEICVHTFRHSKYNVFQLIYFLCKSYRGSQIGPAVIPCLSLQEHERNHSFVHLSLVIITVYGTLSDTFSHYYDISEIILKMSLNSARDVMVDGD